MLQLIGLLAISWAILWFAYKKDLSVLGLMPTRQRLSYFAVLFIVSAICSASAYLLKIQFLKETYVLSQSLTIGSVLLEIWYQFRTVLTEELLCRGVILYILIKRIGATKAIVISSVFFAILHWLNAGVWGNMIQMMIVFAFTFTMGLLLAYAYARTFSLLLPFAIHYGWNLTQNYIFPDSSTGNHIFTLAAPPPSVTVSYLIFFTLLLLPKVSVLLANYLIVKQYKQAQMP